MSERSELQFSAKRLSDSLIEAEGRVYSLLGWGDAAASAHSRIVRNLEECFQILEPLMHPDDVDPD